MAFKFVSRITTIKCDDVLFTASKNMVLDDGSILEMGNATLKFGSDYHMVTDIDKMFYRGSSMLIILALHHDGKTYSVETNNFDPFMRVFMIYDSKERSSYLLKNKRSFEIKDDSSVDEIYLRVFFQEITGRAFTRQ